MIQHIVIFFTVYILLHGIIISIGYFLQIRKERPYFTQGNKIDVNNIVVLIPFRNEARRIGPLLKCINEQTKLPREFIFIDDHSSDEGVASIHNELNIKNYRILSLPEDVFGKKKALRYAIDHSESEYILTLDADIEMAPDYFENIGQLGQADLYVLSVTMIPKSFLEYFYEIDLVLVNAANAGLAGLARPIMASGANLLYRRDTFERVDDLGSHINAASGDDTYLLRDFRENDTDVRLVTHPATRVTTETPQSFREFIDQRLRWIGKTRDIKDVLANTVGILQSLLIGVFLAMSLTMILKAEWMLLIIFISLKALVDMLLFYFYFQRIGKLTTWWLIPIYEILFPFYSLLIGLLVLIYKPKWKGRGIYEK